MRILHTSDWHLGRTLHGVDLLDAQRDVLGQICDLVAAPPDGIAVDAVIIAGDVYDRAVPPVEAVTLLADVLHELTRHTTVILTAGNHDSAIRLGFGSALFGDRLHVRTRLDSVGTPVLVNDVAIYPLPYLDPDQARIALAPGAASGAASGPSLGASSGASSGAVPARSHQAVAAAAMDRVRTDLASRPAGTRSVVVAHLFVCDSAASDSERPIAVGGVDSVHAATFDGVNYVALGHLHGPQTPARTSSTTLHYSGSPLRYSLSERSQTKSVTLVDLAEAESAPAPGGGIGASPRLTPMPLRQLRPMADLAGDIAELLTDPVHTAHAHSWVRLTVTDRARPDQMVQRLRSLFSHALQIVHSPPALATAAPHSTTAATEQRPAQLAADFVRYVTGTDVSAEEIGLFEHAFEQAVACTAGA